MSGFMVLFAFALWVLFGLAVVSHVGGNPTAINGVVGIGICLPIFTAIAWVSRR